MKSLLAKILLALIASTVLALLVTGAVTRVALQHGFVAFLEHQEERQLDLLAPELADYFRRAGSWARLRENPRAWMALLARSRPEGVRPPPGAFPERPPEPGGDSGAHRGWRPVPPERGTGRDEALQLWRRLFVLDQDRRWVAGARYPDAAAGRTRAVVVDGRTVGWVGFRPLNAAATPEARRFLTFQRRTMLVSLLVALSIAIGLGFWLARNIARPVGRVRTSVAALTAGDFAARTGVRRNDEIGELAHHVDRLAETLARNQGARRRWTADIAHELRTPVAILRGELDAVQDGVRALDATTLRSLSEEVDQLARLVDDLQTLALADAGVLELRPEKLDASALVGQVVETFADRARAADLRLESRLPERLTLRGDPQRLRQLLHNLLDNAVRYTAAGGTVRISLAAAGDRARLVVEDSAPGLEPAQRARVFERFYRAEQSRGRSGGGTGLGLAICREIVAAHGGEIQATDSPLGGLGICVCLPLAA